MIKANFNAYGSYVTDSVTQWDKNQILSVTGLNLVSAPEVHFSNANMRSSIVRQAKMEDHIVEVKIPNSLLQQALIIKAEIGVYEGETFKTVEVVEIPVRAAKIPEDYTISDDEEIYSFNRLENELANKADNARVDHIIAHNNDTSGNTELLDIRVDINGEVHGSAGSAVRKQIETLRQDNSDIKAVVNDVSKSNLIKITDIIPVTEQNSLIVEYKSETDELIFNGNASVNTSFDLYIDSEMIDLSEYDMYVVLSNTLITEQDKVWGIRYYYTDGTNSEYVYTDINHFQPLTGDGKTIYKIRILFGEGFVFDNFSTRIYTAYYINKKMTPYEPRYTPKSFITNDILGYDKLAGKKWVSIGDSITANTGNIDGVEWQKGVAEYFGLKYEICAEGGRTTSGFMSDDMYSLIPADTDIITVMGGTNDFSQDLQLAVDTDEYYYNNGSYSGSIRAVIKKLQSDFPDTTIIFCTCLGVKLENAGASQDLPTKNNLGLTMVDYANKCLEVCQSMNIPCINLCGESGINFLNGYKYLDDNVHPNEKGYDVISRVYINNFKRLFG